MQQRPPCFVPACSECPLRAFCGNSEVRRAELDQLGEHDIHPEPGDIVHHRGARLGRFVRG